MRIIKRDGTKGELIFRKARSSWSSEWKAIVQMTGVIAIFVSFMFYAMLSLGFPVWWLPFALVSPLFVGLAICLALLLLPLIEIRTSTTRVKRREFYTKNLESIGVRCKYRAFDGSISTFEAIFKVRGMSGDGCVRVTLEMDDSEKERFVEELQGKLPWVPVIDRPMGHDEYLARRLTGSRLSGA